ncbi:hypothetical protein NB640_07650 [Oxalobacter vibrioformis]|uniref:VCBS repeat-containing protein n=1 Tax=Oxalobacter vibrioformis TaxID=933080 RepID=A0A9E9LU18_9BURK|nr:FG-GAP repeat protein [Oxalobacter vibrioformis]WAW09156.1 hypothetical protein NB640_07650 [Oxalobacter vibrioformis]
MKRLCGFLLFAFLFSSAVAQTRFTLPGVSENYLAEISVICKKDECGGPGEIKLFSKKTGKLFQTFHSDDLFFFPSADGQPSVSVVELYGEQSVLIFDDFNFDGHEDIAIRNGNESGYGGPSYDVYVYNITRKKFMPSEELTALAHDNLGMFHVDHQRKRLVTFSKSGCCWHLATEYEVVPGKGLLKVYEFEEAMTASGDMIEVTARTLVNGQWVIESKRVPTAAYYPDETAEKP